MGKAVKKFKLAAEISVFIWIDKNHHFQERFSFSFQIVCLKVFTHRAGLAVGGVVTLGGAPGALEHLDALLHEAGVGPHPGQDALHLGLAHNGLWGLDVGQL